MLIFSAQMLADFEENWTEMLPSRPIVRMDALHPRRALLHGAAGRHGRLGPDRRAARAPPTSP